MTTGLAAPPLGRFVLTLALVAMGAGWGLTQPLSKIAVSAGHGAMGLVFWQLVVGAVLLSAINAARGVRLPMGRQSVMLYVFIAVLGTVLPNWGSFTSAYHLPAGVMSIVISAVPMFAFPIALALGTDRFSVIRLTGLLLGLAGVALIALPETSLPDRAMVAFLPLALLAPFCYAVEGNVVGRWGTGGLDALQVLQGASIIGSVIALPLAFGMGQMADPRFAWGLPELAFLTSASIHAIVYSTYVWIVGRAGAVFATQVSYLVTGFGILWAMILLGERYSVYIWVALAAMLLGLTLVRPRPAQEEL
ncbi:DMT family transporter [Flavimaricola marinus]|uniref:Putative DMT superfamily transporter inner membrane protein n=1 Tax=Flavimaricola marinus TaxID=1819565 RepID=A0A238LG47_9RHOB|nr:DMT family transporter [Flavimaricola marinus]SMY08552.1 putative DMT superfamily transporter inner membrane protein [Flavimaricola marinus]